MYTQKNFETEVLNALMEGTSEYDTPKERKFCQAFVKATRRNMRVACYRKTGNDSQYTWRGANQSIVRDAVIPNMKKLQEKLRNMVKDGKVLRVVMSHLEIHNILNEACLE